MPQPFDFDPVAWRLEQCERQFRDTGNPVFVWDAIRAIIDGISGGRPPLFPEWILAYLERVSGNFNRLARMDPPPTDVPAAIADALEFHRERRTNPLRAISDQDHDREIAFAVGQEVIRGTKLDAALMVVAEQHPALCRRHPPCPTISASTVRRVWRTHQPSYFPTLSRKGQMSGDN